MLSRSGDKAPVPLKQQVIVGSMWTIASFGASQVLRLASNVVLTRLLSPAMFGMMAIVNIFLMGLQMFSDIGIGPSIVQHRRGDDPVFLNTAWTLQVIRGATLWLLSCALAWPVARLYDEPLLCWVIPVAAMTAVVAGFNATVLFTLNRNLAMRRLTILELTAQSTGIVVMILWAWFHRSVWALVAGGLATSACTLILSWRLSQRGNRFAWDSESRHMLLGFGRLVFLSTAITFLAGQGERLILGKLVSLETLGIYTVAFTMAQLGTRVAKTVFQKVFFPGFAQMFRQDSARAAARYCTTRWVIDLSSVVMAVLLMAFGPWAVRVLYDPRYWDAGWMLQILAVQGAWDIMRAPAAVLLLAAGKPGYSVWAGISRVAVLCVGLPLSMHLPSDQQRMYVAVWIIALSAVPSAVVYMIGVCRVFPKMAWREILIGLSICVLLPLIFWVLH